MIRRHFIQGVILSLALSVYVAAQAGNAVWKIGDFDNSSEEFGPASSAPKTFVVGRSGAQDWPGTQQAVVPSKTGAAVPHRIEFELPEVSQSVYRLRLGLLYKTARAPVVEVAVNGRRGWFYQRLETYGEGNSEGAILPQYSIGAVDVDVPAGFLRAGRNEISLLAVADPLSTALPGGETTDADVLYYDALEFSALKGEAAAAGVTEATVAPTVFYRRDGGRLKEVVSVMLRWHGLAPRGSVTLSLAGWSDTQALDAGREFGEQRLEFDAPEFNAGARADVTVRANGRDYRFNQTVS
ncbi:MAG TPA: polysaccharide lyase family protein, partial [Pyrinomonadaceae bacterium]|nr:polysaccharide lyase family protein [Pyrinomonadaceae bacterium]